MFQLELLCSGRRLHIQPFTTLDDAKAAAHHQMRLAMLPFGGDPPLPDCARVLDAKGVAIETLTPLMVMLADAKI